MNDEKIKNMIYTSLLAALICVATFTIKVPSVVTNGYVHLGDGFIFIAVILLGSKNGAWAGSIGASLADLLGGYSHYAIPTFIIKGIMVLIMGYIIKKIPGNSRFKWVAGALVGSVWQIISYYVVGSVMVGSFISTIMDIPGNIIQSIFGIIVAIIFVAAFKKTSIGHKIINE
ncbi:putative membrane protein [Sedimentibacter acidaminivorans]|uniref:Membrane protein n=1 Tax=Sedimentibacter acidaminivorans TaxID=913099 RepID=A0ABS4GFS9_9FIRM|nr:ECF transporter S component [Sedimentibacter acidaminivorans]MBP1926548.1 putative membrane protein [Sedimentibacter acidaminivorans]